MKQMAAVSAADIQSVSCLPDSGMGDPQRDFKRYLFYILGYCDTFHDFHASRLKDNGDSEKGQITGLVRRFGSLTPYILDVLGKLDPDFDWIGKYYNAIDTVRLSKKNYTFENAMFSVFTKIKGNPISPNMPAPYDDQFIKCFR